MMVPPAKMPPSIILDLDGTLVDTLDDISTAINTVLTMHGVAHVSQERLRSLIGEGLSTLLQRAATVDDKQAVAALVRDYAPVYEKCMLEQTRLYDGVADMLDALVERDVSLCVLSNKPHRFTRPICNALLARWPFVDCLGHRDGSHRKPDPAVARELAANMKRSPQDVWFVGDSAIDIQTAHAAGMVSVAVTWGYRDVDELRSAEPMHIVDRPGDILRLIPSV